MQLVQLLTIVVLARLLTPSDFGLMSMMTVVTSFVMIFNDLGTSSAIVQRKHPTQALYSSVFWLNVSFATVLALIVALSSPLVAWFYQEPRIISLLSTLSISLAFSGFGVLQQAILQREMKFDRLARVQITAVMCSATAGIFAAFQGAGVWSLVIQTITMSFTRSMLLWKATKWRPDWYFDWNKLRSIFNYSANLTMFSVLLYASRNADYLLAGRYLGKLNLGYYTLAYRIMLYPLQNISWVVSRVMFPSFSQIQDDSKRMASAYLKVVAMTASITFPLMIGLAALAEPFVLAVFGQAWSSIILLLVILAPLGALQSIITTVGPIYQSKGRTDLLLRVGGATAISCVIAFIIGVQWGVLGLAISYTTVYVLATYPNFAVPLKLIQLPMLHLWQVLMRPLLASILMLATLVWLQVLLPVSLHPWLVLSLTVPLGGLVYVLGSWLYNRDTLYELLKVIGLYKG
jgi:PST family polysaccharide transporter